VLKQIRFDIENIDFNNYQGIALHAVKKEVSHEKSKNLENTNPSLANALRDFSQTDSKNNTGPANLS